MENKSDSDVIFVGKKPIMSYVLAVLTNINSGYNSVRIKARGMSISKAVDVSQLVTRKFSKELKISNVEIGTEELTDKDNKPKNVSYISIEMRR